MEIGLLWLANQARAVDPWGRYAGYVEEILQHAGLPYRRIGPEPERLATQVDLCFAIVIPANLHLPDDVKEALSRFVAGGKVLIGLGGPSGLEAVFGCRDRGPLREAWVGSWDTSVLPMLAGMSGPLHAFGGRWLEPVDFSVEVLASWLDGDRWCQAEGWQKAEVGPAVTLRRVGRGWAVLIGADVAAAVVRIQQGRPVYVDGIPPADGSAPVDDGILKTDDGIVLDYERDRQPIADTYFFGCPVADEWRELLIRFLLWAARATNSYLPMLWYWPRPLAAVGLLSHDTDLNEPDKADLLLENLKKLGIPSTWCVVYPGGYSPGFYRQLDRDGYEIALHYDARTQLGQRFWDEHHLRLQLCWLRDMIDEQQPIVSNKNHYLRWEGLTEFFHWLERAGIRCDQTKGPSKKGNTGFPFGGAHPWFPMDEHTAERIDVLEINLMTQDLVLTCPAEIGRACVDQAIKHYGVAHFLFHPAHVEKPGIPQAMADVVTYGREQGIEWWTSSAIQSWERTRRQIQLQCTRHDSTVAWVAKTSWHVPEATFVLFDPTLPWGEAETLQRKSGSVAERVSVYGFPAVVRSGEVAPDLPFVLV